MKNPNLDAMLTIAHLNLRREKAGEDEGPMAADVKLTAELGRDAIKGLFRSQHSYKMVMGNLWTEKGELASSDVAEIKLVHELQACRVALKPEGDSGESFDGADLNKIRIEPLPNHVCKVTLRLQVHPDEEQIAWLAAHLDVEVRVTAAQKQGNLDLQQGDSAGAAAAPVH